MVKLRAPERNLLSNHVDIAICRCSASNNHLEAFSPRVASISRVLIWPHEGQLVLADVHSLKVEEDIWVKCTLVRVGGEIWLGCLSVQAEVHSVLHAEDEVLPDKLCQVYIGILPEAQFDDLRRKLGMSALILEEGAYAALQVPHKMYLLCSLASSIHRKSC